jgi:hypothetical protein
MRNGTFILGFIFLSGATGLIGLQTTAAAAESPIVRIELAGDGWCLSHNGRPFFVKGAVGWSRFDELAAAGANTVRTGANEKRLNEAQRAGLSVLAGLPLGIPRHGFDYLDTAKVTAQRDRIREIVLRLRKHPAILMWAIGNEPTIFTPKEQRVLLWQEVNRLAEMIKSLDPNRPVITVVGGEQWRNNMDELDEFCPALDAVGLNAYADMLQLPEDLQRQGWKRPYLITEFGPRGHWQVGRTPWGARIEDSSTEKAGFYRRAYEHAVKDRPQCLGAFAFLWGWKMEKTHTWYGMFLEDGSRTAAVDVMRFLWTGQWPANRCPFIGPAKIQLAIEEQGSTPAATLPDPAPAIFTPGSKLRCSLNASDPEGDPLMIEWDLRRDVSEDPRVGGDSEPLEPAIKGAVLQVQNGAALIQLPAEPGKYRIFAYARDGHGGVATVNRPILIQAVHKQPAPGVDGSSSRMRASSRRCSARERAVLRET